jgi:DNA-binding MarR family transcriptional regulator
MKKTDYRKLCHPAHPEFRLATSPFYLMAHADFDYHEDMSAVLEKHGVDRSVYRIMTVLREHDSANIGFLAERALMKRNTASRVVERMVAKGLAKTFPNPDDSRITEVVLTPKGKEMLNSLTPIVGRQFQRAIDGISNEDLEHLVLVLQRITRNLTRLPIEAAGEVTSERRLSLSPLPAGQAWTASEIGSTGATSVSRVEVAATRGSGVRLVNASPTATVRTGVKAASDYLHRHAADLVGSRDPGSQELAVEVHPLNGGKVGGPLGVGLLLAFCSALVKKPLRAGLVVVGELSGDTVKTIQQPAEFVETAVREGARAILIPVSARRKLADLSDELATQIEIVFYANVSDAVTKALQE